MDNYIKRIGEALLLMYSTKDASVATDRIIRPTAHFKIDKSGEPENNTKARYVPEAYSNWTVVYRQEDPLRIDNLERALITSTL